ncbi:MAG: MATE family efflux transporter [Desulfovibrio sp.]|jgi:MATE family multidrug resistance protein|nr:MATE family efflux transporter [Desulfovibrio sp.]
MNDPDLSTTPRAVWRLTWPQMLMMYLVFSTGFAMVWVAGQINADAQAALGMVSQVGIFLMFVIMAVSSGATAAVSQSLGARKVLRAQRYVGATVAGSAALGILVAFGGYCLEDEILALLLIPERILPIARELWQVAMLTLPAQYLYTATGVIFRATRQVIPPLWVAAFICAGGLFACLGFGLGFFGLPAFGYMGLAWTNFVMQCVGAACNCFLLARSGYLQRRAMPGSRWLRAGLPYLLKVALPAGAASLVWHSGYLTLFVLVASLPQDSVNALAGLTAGLRTEALLFLPGMAFNMSTAVLVGNCLGAGKSDEAKRIALNMVALGTAAMTLIAALLWPFRPELARLLSTDQGVQTQIISYLTYNLLSTPFSISSTIMGGIMVGAGATRYNLMVFGGTFWLVRLPLGWFLGHVLWGTASGVFLAMLLSQCLQACVMLRVVLRRDWTRFAMRRHEHTNAASEKSLIRR